MPPATPEVEVFEHIEQGSEEWKAVRLGIPTASEFKKVMASGKDGGESEGRRRLLYRLAGEVLTKESAETYENVAMRRGKEMEPEARSYYEFTRGVEAKRVGFVRRTMPIRFGGRQPVVIGCSPDSLIGEDGALEIKTMFPELLIELAEKGRLPTEHRAQCQGTLLVTGRKWIDLMIFYRGMPVAPTFRVVRDEVYIKELIDALEVFTYDLRKLIEKVKNMGGVR